MQVFKGKISQRSAIGLSTLALVAAIAAPSTVMGQSITLNRCPAAGNSDPTCTAQFAVPIAAQKATLAGTLDPSITNSESNSVDQSATNRNRASAEDLNSQKQRATQTGGDQSNDQSNDVPVDATAAMPTSGGAATAVGPVADISFTLQQGSDASAHGDANVTQVSGQAGGNASASGSIDAAGGDAAATSSADGGGDNGNTHAMSVARMLDSGNAHASTDAGAGNGGKAKASGGGDATSTG